MYSFYLMCKDIKVARVDFENLEMDIYRYDLLPFRLRHKGVDEIVTQDWIYNRLINKDRDNSVKILSSVGLNPKDRMSILEYSKGLTLTDCYWFKDENDEKTTWDKVNLYKNHINSDLARIALTSKFKIIEEKVLSPEFTSQGLSNKCWKRFKNKLYLYKTHCNKGRKNEHKIEVLCSDILDILNVEHVKYSLTKIEETEVCKCENLTTEDKSICSLLEYAVYCEKNRISAAKWILEQELYYKILIVDYLIFNSTRGLEDLGIYFDSNTGKCLGLHPLYGNSKAFNTNGSDMSSLIKDKTLKECAKYAKRKCNINIDELEKWANSRRTMKRFYNIFGNYKEYIRFNKRIREYKTWR